MRVSYAFLLFGLGSVHLRPLAPEGLLCVLPPALVVSPGVSRPAGAVAVAEFIAESPRLLRLDLRENEIKTGGLMALSLALKVNHSLLRLDLDREPKKESVSLSFCF